MRHLISQSALLILALTAVIGFQFAAAEQGWGPKIDRVYFIKPYSPGPNGETMMMVLEGENFTTNSRVMVDGEKVSSRFSAERTLQVYIDTCSAPDRHSVVVEDRD